MSNSNDLTFTNIEPDKIQIYNNVDLNSLFNLNYNFDLLKGIIGALLKNQQALQKQVEQANYVKNENDKTIESLKNEIIEIKEKYTTREDFVKVQDKMNKVNEIYQVFDEQQAKSKYQYILFYQIWTIVILIKKKKMKK